MALTTLYNSTNHPLTWDKINETLKTVDDNFTFVNSQATTGILTNLSQDVTPNAVGTFDLGTPTQRWDNVYANTISVSSLISNVTGDLTGSVFADDSTIIIDATEGTLAGNLTGNVVGDITGSVTNPNSTTVVVNNLGAVTAFTGNLTGDVVGNLTGNADTVTNGVYVSGDQTIAGVKTFSNTIVGSTQGTHTGGVVGNVTGNVTGNVDGDVNGSVYSDDSSGVLVDGAHGVLNTYKLDRVGATDGQALVWDESNLRWQPGAGGGGGGIGLGSRTTKSASTASLADQAIGNTSVIGAFKSYAVLKIQVDEAAWVRVYTDSASRTADASRLETADPAPSAGVVVETITTGASTVLISPAVYGFNNENPVTDVIPIAVKNKSGGTATVTVTLTLLQLEA